MYPNTPELRSSDRRPDSPSVSAEASARGARRARYSRWRAASLASVYVLMGLHVAHWKIAGKTLAPLELNEVMYTLELGIVTAGFLFMLVACVLTLLFGRFFCGWGCHILALEDLCVWLLARLRIRPRPIRSRLLLLVPPLAMFYMFVWPQVARIAAGHPLPTVHVATDEHGWASFQTTDFWRNLPGPGVALLTFGVCGFAIVYVLGSRSFCTYACPYGAVFRGLDRLSPGRIVATGDCSKCGVCTAVCPSQVKVHEELLRFGTVINPACVKDLECVAACPTGVVRYGLGRPPLLRGWRAWQPLRHAVDFTLAEEALMALVLVASLLTFRGLYDLAPFLLTLALGAILAYVSVCLTRLAFRSDVRLATIWIKDGGRTTKAGRAVLAAAGVFLFFWAHSAFIRYHEFCGYRLAHDALPPSAPLRPVPMAGALAHLETCWNWGLFTSPRLAATLGQLYAARGTQRGDSGDAELALADLSRAAGLQPQVAAIRFNLAVLLSAQERDAEAIGHYRWAAALDPRDPDTQNNLGLLLARRGQWNEAEYSFRRALELNARHADAEFNLGRLLWSTGRSEQALSHLQAAAKLDARYAAYREGLFVP